MSRNNHIGMAVIQLLVGYELFDSGWNKLFAPKSFAAGLAGNLKGMIQGPPPAAGWYAGFTNSVVIPHAVLFGYMVEWGEFLAGVGLIVAALVFLFRKHEDDPWYRVFSILSIAALTGGVFMVLNFYAAGGAPSPFPGLNDPNGEGVTIDIFLPMLSLVLLWWNAAGLAAAGKNTDAAQGTRHGADDRLTSVSLSDTRSPGRTGTPGD